MNMKKLRCDEAGFRECNWEFLGESDDEVLRKAREHGQQMHNVRLDDGALRSKIRDA
jgi:predicted small metal-binding protein